MELKFRVDGVVWILAALGIFLVPLNFLLGAMLAAAFHESFHVLAIWLTGGKILRVDVHAGGAVIETAPMTAGREVLCALAGPAGSFALLFLARWLPEMALCAGVQGAFNLLPVYPLDGGRVVRGICQLFFPGNGDRIYRWIEGVVLCILTGVGAYFGVWPLILVLIAASKALSKKNSLQSGETRSTIDLPFIKR